MKPGPIIALAVIVGALVFAGVAFKSSLTPYVPFQQAVTAASTESTVQIMGAPVKDETRFDPATGYLSFVLKEKETGATMPVEFKSPKPDNFDQAISIGAIGRYDGSSKTFVADNLLVKCPSKYAGDPSANRSYGAKPGV